MRHQGRVFIFWRMVLCVAVIGVSSSCARLPYTTKVVHEDARVLLRFNRKLTHRSIRIRLNSAQRS